jgi:excisionase family DNA binding protein
MTQTAIPTREVATMLGVTETTVKRWADEGILPCVRTPGGHRKFRLTDIVRFAEENGLTVAGTAPPPMSAAQMEQLRAGVALKDHQRIAAVFKEEALQADREGLYELLLYLLKNSLSFPAIADEVIRPAMAEIGLLWEQGKLAVNQEHAATHAVLEALARMAPNLHRKPAKSVAIVCSGPEGELHDVGLRCLAYSLEAEGWQVRYIGTNTPVADVVGVLRAERPALLCVSVTTVRRKRKLAADLNAIARTARSLGTTFIIGGYGVEELKKLHVRCDHFASGIQDTLAFLKERFQLRPGPRKKQQHAKQLLT